VVYLEILDARHNGACDVNITTEVTGDASGASATCPQSFAASPTPRHENPAGPGGRDELRAKTSDTNHTRATACEAAVRVCGTAECLGTIRSVLIGSSRRIRSALRDAGYQPDGMYVQLGAQFRCANADPFPVLENDGIA
jgi:hypothetical protein